MGNHEIESVYSARGYAELLEITKIAYQNLLVLDFMNFSKPNLVFGVEKTRFGKVFLPRYLFMQATW
jgi:hypothetical protein